MVWAIRPLAVGRPVPYRETTDDAVAGPGEVIVTADPFGQVLAEDRQSLRAPTPAEILRDAREAKLAELVEARDAAIVAPVTWDAAQWSALPEDQANLIQTVSLWDVVRRADQTLLGELAGDGAVVPAAVPWKTIDNDVRMLTFNEAVRLAAAMSLAKQTQFAIYWQLEQLVGAATSEPELALITWPGP